MDGMVNVGTIRALISLALGEERTQIPCAAAGDSISLAEARLVRWDLSLARPQLHHLSIRIIDHVGGAGIMGSGLTRPMDHSLI